MNGQFRSGGFGVTGWDMNAALAMADALGVSTFLVAEMLPDIEAAAIRGIRDMMDGQDNG